MIFSPVSPTILCILRRWAQPDFKLMVETANVPPVPASITVAMPRFCSAGMTRMRLWAPPPEGGLLPVLGPTADRHREQIGPAAGNSVSAVMSWVQAMRGSVARQPD